MALSYDLPAQARQHTQQLSAPAATRPNPWQFILGMLAILPALAALCFYLGAFLKNSDDRITALLLMAYGNIALGVAVSLALLWLLVAAVNWQIKEAARVLRRY